MNLLMLKQFYMLVDSYNNGIGMKRFNSIFHHITYTTYLLRIINSVTSIRGDYFMRTRNKLLTFLSLSAGTTIGISLLNKWIQLDAISKHVLQSDTTLTYSWRLGNVQYTKFGDGKPILLIHNLYPCSSGYEWNRIVSALAQDFTVYTLDLLGYGNSEKPNMTYTNYVYVQLISDFIHNVIGRRTSVIASGESSAIPIMACANNSSLIDQILLISPLSLLEFSQIPGRLAKYYKILLDTPVIGTLIYNFAMSRDSIREYLESTGFYNPDLIHNHLVDSYYESSHLGFSAKSAYSSYKCSYTKINITNAIKRIDNSIFILGGDKLEFVTEIMEEYKSYNPSIEFSLIPNTKALPHIESPDATCEFIKSYLLS